MLNVHHMHTRVCTVFKWNYEQHLSAHTLIPIINRFASTNEPLSDFNYRSFVIYRTRFSQVFSYIIQLRPSDSRESCVTL